MDTTQLTDDQIDFLAQCEADFANRYTDKDDDFSIVMAIGTSRPPIMEPWRPKGGNSYRPDRTARERERDRERADVDLTLPQSLPMNDEASSPSADWGNHTIADLRQPVTKALRPGTGVRCRSRDFVSNWAKAKAETSEMLKLSAEKNDADVHSRKLAIHDMKRDHDTKLQAIELLNAQEILQNQREMRANEKIQMSYFRRRDY
uniref:Uncharacterized protein n=1 Tax=Lygus hesperus TaxID=30085 RepID=A0A146L2J8_LYGHE